MYALQPGGTLPVESGRGRFDLGTVRVLRSRARRSSVVVAHGSSTLLAAFLATLGSDVPFVYRSIGDPLHWVDARLRRWRVGFLLRRAASVVALWSGARDALIARHRLDPDRVVVATNGVPAARFAPIRSSERRTARDRFSFDDSTVVVCWIGSLSAEKDPLTAVQALRRLPAAHLLLAGSGPLRSEVERAAEEASVRGRITMLGEVDDVRSVLAAADVLVLTSVTEGQPAVLIEAGLSQVPVVATHVGGVPEIVRDGRTGVLVDPRDAAAVAAGIERAAADGPALGEQARAHCQRFAMERVAEDWERLLRSVVEGR